MMYYISQKDLQELLICSQRYAIGRMTSAPETVSDIIKCYFLQGALDEFTVRLLTVDIEKSLEEGRAGMECDIKVWKDLAETLKNTKEFFPHNES